MNFSDLDLFEKLIIASDDDLDAVNFGIIGINNQNNVVIYNKAEEEYSSYHRNSVVGKNLFLDIAPCMNNYMVALKFEERDSFDETIPYVLSFKVKPAPVQLRLIKKDGNGFVLIKKG
ncbi:MAG: hypothetical protein A2015_01095 [Spirochaetes bacterium GWF1_31_7]|nr:MAG: hypothetical protein A2Y30_00995 [Spirochaetes bacterium GWE1_32_154]OHD47895.1 MAG: hypothetical protein A2015_01095 [Spirochaetes bacterium GWF1_31_7]OHD48886.1 MAG: hypothetical protein A2Y29_16810 [Spirochaetes bacterium GWE2_31_10]OHD82975.1 MAG: hypothetical protein A2355_04300 [Spirochaetes bacterium RIFOXYB1_FULL_32_8]HBD96519.1 phosphonate transporter [Spirochaetia bacterium]